MLNTLTAAGSCGGHEPHSSQPHLYKSLMVCHYGLQDSVKLQTPFRKSQSYQLLANTFEKVHKLLIARQWVMPENGEDPAADLLYISFS